MNRRIIASTLILVLTMIGFVSAISFNGEETDVAVVDIIIYPENPELGDTVDVKIILQNLGDVATNVTFTHGVETPWGGFGGGNCPHCLELDSNEIYVLQLDFVASAAGKYIINASVESEIPDSNPENNQLSLTFIVEEDTCPADFNEDGTVGASDLLTLLVSWGPCPEGLNGGGHGSAGEAQRIPSEEAREILKDFLSEGEYNNLISEHNQGRKILGTNLR